MTWLFLALHLLLIAGFGLRILLRDDVRPDVRMGWLTVIVLLPYASCALYYPVSYTHLTLPTTPYV